MAKTSTKQPKKILALVDGNALVHRAFHAISPLTTSDGRLVHAVYGFFQILFGAIEKIQPTHVAVVFDAEGKTFRHEQFENYKAHRERQPDELYDQFGPVKEIVEALNIPIFSIAGVEADDVIGSIVHQKIDADTICYIITGDHDVLQLVTDNVLVYAPRKTMSDVGIYTTPAVVDRYGFGPEHIVDYKALRGDTSDNIPGIKGIGEKTATDLILLYGGLDDIYKALSSGKIEKDRKIKERMIELLRNGKESAYTSKMLATILTDVDMNEWSMDAAVFGDYDIDKVKNVLQKYEFRSLMQRVLKWSSDHAGVDIEKLVDDDMSEKKEKEQTNKNTIHGHTVEKTPLKQNYICIDDEQKFNKFISEIKKQKEIVIDTETTNIDPFRSHLVGVSFCWKEGIAYYLPLSGEGTETLPTKKWFAEIKKIIEDDSIEKIGHNLKYDIEALGRDGIELKGKKKDTLLIAYLFDPGSRTLSLDKLSFHYFGYTMQPISELIGVGKKQLCMDSVPLEKVAWYSAEDADMTYRLYYKLVEKMSNEGDILPFYNRFERPLLDVLVYMERIGCLIDISYLKKLHNETEKKINIIEKDIYKLSGKEFNINSPKQMQEVLFDEMKISVQGLKKTKTGISTAADMLEKMKSAHPIIEKILEYRELSKLQSTYIDALPALVNEETGRIHTSYNQAVTSTGRLSSSNPNLQNIPIRSELGKEIRRSFVAPKGYSLVSIDYSQMELRIVAHMSDDPVMKQIFEYGKDVHASTAAFVFGIDESEVTQNMRRVAKEVNFGILYGMGAWGLAERTGLSRQEAKKFIDTYFEKFIKIKEFVDNIKDFAKKNKYVETVFGRRRYLPNIDSGIASVRAATEREAINMPIQGTAADIMKLGMIKAYEYVLKNHPTGDVRMILTVHDELVFEIKKEIVEDVSFKLRDIIEHAYELSVPLKCAVSVGDTWGDFK